MFNSSAPMNDPANRNITGKHINIEIATKNNIDIKGKTSYEVRDILINKGFDVCYMKGTNGMLPTTFDYQPRGKNDKVMEAEKPVELLESIISYISNPFETLLDQYAGSGNFVVACLNTNRNSIAIEKDEIMFNKMVENIQSQVELDDCELER